MNIVDTLKVSFHCTLRIIQLDFNHSMVETWINYEDDLLPIKHDHKVWCTCGYGNKTV